MGACKAGRSTCSAVSAVASGPPGTAVRPASSSSPSAACDVAGAPWPSSHRSLGSPCGLQGPPLAQHLLPSLALGDVSLTAG